MKTEYVNLSTPFEIPCKIYIPDAQVQKVIVAVHGLLGSKESKVIYAVADRLTQENTAVISFDFPSHGTSKLNEDMLTVENCKAALLAVADFSERRFPEVYDFGFFATSFGGFILLNSLTGLKEILGDFRIVLRAPAINMDMSLLRVAGITQDELKSRGSITCGSERTISISYSFYEDILAHNVNRDFNQEMMIIHGNNDTIVTQQDIFDFIKLNNDIVYAPVKDANHFFENKGDVDSIVNYAQMWFVYRANDAE